MDSSLINFPSCIYLGMKPGSIANNTENCMSQKPANNSQLFSNIISVIILSKMDAQEGNKKAQWSEKKHWPAGADWQTSHQIAYSRHGDLDGALECDRRCNRHHVMLMISGVNEVVIMAVFHDLFKCQQYCRRYCRCSCRQSLMSTILSTFSDVNDIDDALIDDLTCQRYCQHSYRRSYQRSLTSTIFYTLLSTILLTILSKHFVNFFYDTVAAIDLLC